MKSHGGEKGEGFTISDSVSLHVLGNTLSQTQMDNLCFPTMSHFIDKFTRYSIFQWQQFCQILLQSLAVLAEANTGYCILILITLMIHYISHSKFLSLYVYV